ncbi:uncharacterized protein [Montipora foliosa]|uniref:uncharacterized protein n=1 Tax=Montipora foliosa TaxID=591990 RepID=UPI0035F10B2D
MAAPFLLTGKKILQDLCRTKLDWDDKIDDEFRVRWENWRSQLSALEHFSMDRCVKRNGFGSVISRQIHHFSDASAIGYGQVTYLRNENDKGNIHCSFLKGKSRLAPLKAMTIPRLVLKAATISVRIGGMISRESDDPVDSETYWTDSTSVLNYIQNKAKRFHVFVANRVQSIRDQTDPAQWRYVESKNNPADDASGCLNGYQLSDQQRWTKGPDFVWLSESEWPEPPCVLNSVLNNDPDVKKVQVLTTVVDEKANILTRLARFSNWHRMKRCIAWILRLKQLLTHKQLPLTDKAHRTRNAAMKDTSHESFTVEEMQHAEKTILRLVQDSAFPRELEVLRKIQREHCQESRDFSRARKAEIKKSSTLYQLDPVLDKNGLLRVGGRLGKSRVFPDDFKHPVILPKKSFMVNLVIRDAHERVGHSGRSITLGALSSRYWIINANSVVRHFISKCVTCRRLRGVISEQKMADLPKERLSPAPPFTYCGLDYFGPLFYQRRTQGSEALRCVVYLPFKSAVHIETANSLETDSFVSALRRFVARRGPVLEIRSGQGTNLVGAEKELRRALEKMDNGSIQRSLCREFKADWLQWKRNLPSASHMDGVWERQIRSVR